MNDAVVDIDGFTFEEYTAFRELMALATDFFEVCPARHRDLRERFSPEALKGVLASPQPAADDLKGLVVEDVSIKGFTLRHPGGGEFAFDVRPGCEENLGPFVEVVPFYRGRMTGGLQVTALKQLAVGMYIAVFISPDIEVSTFYLARRFWKHFLATDDYQRLATDVTVPQNVRQQAAADAGLPRE